MITMILGRTMSNYNETKRRRQFCNTILKKARIIITILCLNDCKYMKHIFELRMKAGSNRRKILAVTTQLKQLRKESLKKIQA